jgi:hypothetical protein
LISSQLVRLPPAVVLHAHQHPLAMEFVALEREFEIAFLEAMLGIVGQPVRSQIITVPPPYCPLGMVPSKSP